MTAYLQPGDRIHLAVPISPALQGRAAQDEGARVHTEYVQFYARYGVTVEMTTTIGNPALTAPVVVAVFRTPDAA